MMQTRETKRFLETVELLEQALDLKELLWMGIFDIEEAKTEVEKLKREFRKHRSKWDY
jgi:hypothetical protein